MQPEARRVLITGGGSGIGRALALEAARRGMQVAICGRRPEPLHDTARRLGDGAGPVIVADITEASDRARVVRTLTEGWGGLEVLVNNAGLVHGGDVALTGDAALEATFQTNVLAPMALTRDLRPLLMAARPSRVVNIGSVFGEIAYPGFAAYSASKFALRGFSSALRREWAKAGIGVTYAAPRATRTDAAAAFDAMIAAGGMRLDDPAKVAAAIWQAVEAGSDEVHPAGMERLFLLVQRLAPQLIDRALARPAPTLAP